MTESPGFLAAWPFRGDLFVEFYCPGFLKGFEPDGISPLRFYLWPQVLCRQLAPGDGCAQTPPPPLCRMIALYKPMVRKMVCPSPFSPNNRSMANLLTLSALCIFAIPFFCKSASRTPLPSTATHVSPFLRGYFPSQRPDTLAAFLFAPPVCPFSLRTPSAAPSDLTAWFSRPTTSLVPGSARPFSPFSCSPCPPGVFPSPVEKAHGLWPIGVE